LSSYITKPISIEIVLFYDARTDSNLAQEETPAFSAASFSPFKALSHILSLGIAVTT